MGTKGFDRECEVRYASGPIQSRGPKITTFGKQNDNTNVAVTMLEDEVSANPFDFSFDAPVASVYSYVN